MTQVQDLMAFGALTVNADEQLDTLVGRMRRIGHEGYPVLDDEGRVVGLLTARDMNRAAENGLEHLRVRDVMMAGEVIVTPETKLGALLERMVETGWGQIPVVKNNALVGIVTRTDVIQYYADLEAERVVRHEEMQSVLGTPAAGLIAFVAQHAAERGQTIYMVGGVVRDLLLKRPNYDIDFVLEGDAIAFAHSLVERYGGKAPHHDAFGTAKWAFDEEAAWAVGASAGDLPEYIDIVTARHEFYEEPAVLPTVYDSGIRLDLRRRDFTINALAVRCSADEGGGTVIDLFGGLRDLENGTIRVLHSLSFADDPTRILRGVRFSHRLGFQIEPRTAELIQNALPMLKRITGERVRNELTLLLKEPQPHRALLRLQEMGVLQAIHPAFVLQDDLLERALSGEEPPHPPQEPDVFGWALVATSMDAEYVLQVTERLLFNRAATATMKAAALLTEFPEEYLSGKPSVITFGLERHPLDAVLAAWVALPLYRATIELFLDEWRHVRIVTDGNTLKEMGLPPGPRYKTILERLRAGRIDGTIGDETQALHDIIESE